MLIHRVTIELAVIVESSLNTIHWSRPENRHNIADLSHGIE